MKKYMVMGSFLMVTLLGALHLMCMESNQDKTRIKTFLSEIQKINPNTDEADARYEAIVQCLKENNISVSACIEQMLIRKKDEVIKEVRGKATEDMVMLAKQLSNQMRSQMVANSNIVIKMHTFGQCYLEALQKKVKDFFDAHPIVSTQTCFSINNDLVHDYNVKAQAVIACSNVGVFYPQSLIHTIELNAAALRRTSDDKRDIILQHLFERLREDYYFVACYLLLRSWNQTEERPEQMRAMPNMHHWYRAMNYVADWQLVQANTMNSEQLIAMLRTEQTAVDCVDRIAWIKRAAGLLEAEKLSNDQKS